MAKRLRDIPDLFAGDVDLLGEDTEMVREGKESFEEVEGGLAQLEEVRVVLWVFFGA